MRKLYKATRRKQNFQYRLRIEPLESRNLLTLTLPNGMGELATGTIEGSTSTNSGTLEIGTGDLILAGTHQAPYGGSNTASALPGSSSCTLAASDFGFWDYENDAFTRVKITTLPTSGSLLLDDAPVAEGQFIIVADLDAGKLKFIPAVDGEKHPWMTFQVEDSGSTVNGGENLDPSPDTMTFNILPAVQDESYTTIKNTQLDQWVPLATLAIQGNDWVAHGNHYLKGNGSNFHVTGNGSSVNIMYRDAVDSWFLSFSAGSTLNSQNSLVRGKYIAPAWDYLPQPGQPGISISGNGRGPSRPHGSFTVNEVEFGPSGTVLAFDADFTQYDDNQIFTSPMTGHVHYSAIDKGAISVLQNDSDADGDSLTSILVTGPQHGSLILGREGGFLYTPDVGFTGTDSFQYKANDWLANSDVATVTINVLPLSHAPYGISEAIAVASGDSYMLKVEDFGFGDSQDNPPDTFTRVKITTLPGGASLTLDGTAVEEGQFISVADIAAGKLVLAPASGRPHPSFTFQVEDSGTAENGGVFLDPNPKTLTFDVAPVAHDDTYSVMENQVVDQAFVGNHLRITTTTTSPSSTPDTTTIDADGSGGLCTATVTGNKVEFNYPSTIGQFSDWHKVVFAAPGDSRLVPGEYPGAKENADENSPGLAIYGGTFSFQSDGNSQFTVLEALYDDSGNIIRFDATFQLESQMTLFNIITHETIVLSTTLRTGRLQYNATNKPSASVLDNDSDADDDPLTVELAPTFVSDIDEEMGQQHFLIVGQPQHGTLTLYGDGGFLYTPNANFSGMDSFQYAINDGLIRSNPATVSIEVINIHDAPIGTSSTVSISSSGPYAIKAADFGFTDPFDTVPDAFTRVKITSLPTAGSLLLNGTPVVADQFISVGDIDSGNLVFVPDANSLSNPDVQLAFQVEDNGSLDNGGENLDSTPKAISFHCRPIAHDDFYDAYENSELENKLDVTRLQMASQAGDYVGQGQTYFFDKTNTSFIADSTFNIVTIHCYGEAGDWYFRFGAPNGERLATGQYTGAGRSQPDTPQLDVWGNQRGSSLTTGQFTVNQIEFDQDGNLLQLDVIFEQHSEGSPPALLGRLQYHCSRANAVTVINNDVVAPGRILTPILVVGPQHGTLSLDEDGGFFYMPDKYFYGTDTFQYKANDGLADSDIATVSIEVKHVNQAPEGSYGTVNMPAGDPYAMKVADFGFTDPHDTPADSFTGILIDTLPDAGVLKLGDTPVAAGQFVDIADITAGNLTFTPGDSRTDGVHASFTFRVKDSGSTDLGGTVIDLTPKTLTFNIIPVAVDDIFTVFSAPTEIPLFANDTDFDGDGLSLNSVPTGGPLHGTFAVDNQGKFIYTPEPGFYGTDVLHYRVHDGTSVSNSACAVIHVTPPISARIRPISEQSLLTTDSTIEFLVSFSEAVTDFSADAVVLGGTATGALVSSITPKPTNGPGVSNFIVTVSGMTCSGYVSASIAEGKVHTADGNYNAASTNTDNRVEYLAHGITITGTSGDDVFEFYAGKTSSTWTLKVNGRTQDIPADRSGLIIDGKSGSDTVLFHGGNEALAADLSYEQGQIRFGANTFVYRDLEHVTVAGASGNDMATLHGSAGDDAFQGLPNSAQLTTAGKSIAVKNFKSVSALSTTGNDTGVMFGSQAGNSNFEAGPMGVKFAGAGFNYEIAGFKAVSAYAYPGKYNRAVFHSTEGDDLLIASYLGAQYLGEGFVYDVWNLTTIDGLGASGDEARFYGSPGGNTVLNASPSQAIQTENNLTLVATGYAKFSSYVYSGGNTSANIAGSLGDDRAVTSPWGTQLFGTNFELSAWTYKNITLVGNHGKDVVHMYGSSGANNFEGRGTSATLTSGGVTRAVDRFSQIYAHGNASSTATFFAQSGMTNTFDASPTQASMSSAGNPDLAEQTHGLGDMQDSKYGAAYKNVALDFGSNTAYGVAGGTDVVNYADSPGNDYFISSYLGSQFTGTGFSNAAWGFATMNATSTAGSDTARFYGSPTSPDSFVGTPTESRHSGQGFGSMAKNFARVEAYSNFNSRGTAQLTGSMGNDNLVASPAGAQLTGLGYRVEAWNYRSLKTEGNGGSDMAGLYGKAANNKLAADNVFAEFSGDGFANRVEHFATVRVHGSTTGTDTAALDHAYLETGIKDQPDNALGHTVVRKLWLNDFDEITVTEKPTQTTPQLAAVNKLMSAFMFE